MDTIVRKYQEIRARIPKAVTLVAVSKGQPASAIEALYRAGQRDFGENYVQELLAKAKELEASGCPGIRWHFIGHLQTNKVKTLLPLLSYLHSVDSERLARELARRHAASGLSERLPVFIEVNLDGEASKSGVPPQQAPALAKLVGGLPELKLLGLMGVPSPRESPEAMSVPFRQLRELEARCRPGSAGKLSMGMSEDFEVAIREGATHIRVGTAIFGPRSPG